MQVVTIDSNRDNDKRPSTKLQEKIRNCVAIFRSLNETVNEVIEIGKSEGFSPLEIGQFIRNEMLKAGLHRSTAARYLPAELKNKPRGKQVAATTVSRNLRQNQSQAQIQTQSQNQNQNQLQFSRNLLQNSLQPQPTNDIDMEAFSTAAKYLKTETLGKVIDHLAQVYNERTGQKIKVIFRKMINDDGTGTTKDEDKKYQPTPDEVKQREQKIMSLVEEGILRIADLVEQSGVSESATRRYLQKAGYRITAGTISR